MILEGALLSPSNRTEAKGFGQTMRANKYEDSQHKSILYINMISAETIANSESKTN